MSRSIIDPHVHTSESSKCGRLSAEKSVEYYKKEGFSGFVVTDHYSPSCLADLDGGSWKKTMDNYLKGFRLARKYGETLDFTVLPGIELRFPDSVNDFLVFGMNEDFLYEHEYLCLMRPHDFKRFSDDHGLLIFQAHPFRGSCTPQHPDLIHGVEVYNSNPKSLPGNVRAKEFAGKNGLLEICGSDSHSLETAALAGLYVDKLPASGNEFVRLLTDNKMSPFVRTEQ